MISFLIGGHVWAIWMQTMHLGVFRYRDTSDTPYTTSPFGLLVPYMCIPHTQSLDYINIGSITAKSHHRSGSNLELDACGDTLPESSALRTVSLHILMLDIKASFSMRPFPSVISHIACSSICRRLLLDSFD